MSAVILTILAGCILQGATPQGSERDHENREGSVLAVGSVDFWGSKKTGRETQPKKKEPSATVWAEPIRMPDGRFAVYTPAPEVLRFLDDPTTETAMGYLEWQKERLAKLRRAMEVLESVAQAQETREGTVQEEKTPASKTSPTELATKSTSPTSTVITYFRREGCVYCDRQDEILEALRRERPDIVVRKLNWGESPEVWTERQISVTPSLLVEGPGKPPVLLRGLATRESILKAARQEGTVHARD
jgi:hypothetical protein